MSEAQDLITTRGLTEGDFGTPLRKFTGVLDSYAPDEEAKFGTRVVLNFRDVDVIESTEVYLYPIATVSIKLSNRKRSAWGHFSDSLNAIISESEDIKDQIGKKLGLRVALGIDFGVNRQTNEKILANCWEVYSVEGHEIASAGVPAAPVGAAKDRAMELLDGKTLPEFNNVVYADPLVQKDADLLRAITDRTFIIALKAAGMFTEDSAGVMHKTV